MPKQASPSSTGSRHDRTDPGQPPTFPYTNPTIGQPWTFDQPHPTSGIDLNLNTASHYQTAALWHQSPLQPNVPPSTEGYASCFGRRASRYEENNRGYSEPQPGFPDASPTIGQPWTFDQPRPTPAINLDLNTASYHPTAAYRHQSLSQPDVLPSNEGRARYYGTPAPPYEEGDNKRFQSSLSLVPDRNRGQKRKFSGGGYSRHDRHPSQRRFLDYCPATNWNARDYVPPPRARRVGGLKSHQTDVLSSSPVLDSLSDLTCPKNEYPYERLKPGELRLLQLEPGHYATEDVRFSLHTFRDAEMPRYEALSYVWGDTSSSKVEAQANGRPFPLSQNLCAALKALRRENEPQLLWVDAVCINQADQEEREEQVLKMSHIYHNADRVICWLGEGNADSDLGMDNITRLLDLDSLAADNWDQNYEWMAVARLSDSKYWSRSWIVQEVALAKEVVVKFGDRDAHFEDFADAISLIRSKADAIKRLSRRSHRYEEISETLDRLENSPASKLLDMLRIVFVKKTGDGGILARRMTLESLVSDLTSFQATDPRDTIYAVFGLAKDSATTADPLSTKLFPESPAPLRPSYHRSTLDVYADFTAHSVHSSGSLDLICRPWAPLRKGSWQDGPLDPDLRFAIPSWIPVRAKLPYGDPRYQHSRRQNGDSLVGKAQRKIYNTDKGMPVEVRFGMNSLSKTFDGSLYARGFMLGEITDISTRMGDGIVSKECIDMLGGLQRSGEGNLEAESESVWRTLCANRDSNGGPAPSLYRYAMLHILQKLSTNCSIDTIELLTQNQPEYLENFLERIQAVVWDRKVFQARTCDDSAEALVGLAPREAQVHDRVYILYGCSVPVILRRREISKRSCWEVIGECFVDGKMEGEALCGLTKTEIEALTSELELR